MEGVNWILERERQGGSLRIPAILTTNGGMKVKVMALIDTGAESSLVKQGPLPHTETTPKEKPVKMLGVGGETLGGGNRETTSLLHFQGSKIDTVKKYLHNPSAPFGSPNC